MTGTGNAIICSNKEQNSPRHCGLIQSKKQQSSGRNFHSITCGRAYKISAERGDRMVTPFHVTCKALPEELPLLTTDLKLCLDLNADYSSYISTFFSENLFCNELLPEPSSSLSEHAERFTSLLLHPCSTTCPKQLK